MHLLSVSEKCGTAIKGHCSIIFRFKVRVIKVISFFKTYLIKLKPVPIKYILCTNKMFLLEII